MLLSTLVSIKSFTKIRFRPFDSILKLSLKIFIEKRVKYWIDNGRSQSKKLGKDAIVDCIFTKKVWRNINDYVKQRERQPDQTVCERYRCQKNISLKYQYILTYEQCNQTISIYSKPFNLPNNEFVFVCRKCLGNWFSLTFLQISPQIKSTKRSGTKYCKSENKSITFFCINAIP